MRMSGRETMPGDPARPRGIRVGIVEWEATPAERDRRVLVEYVGRTALVVTGPYTGECYRFDQPGSRLSVDPRDRQSLLSVPMLRSVAA